MATNQEKDEPTKQIKLLKVLSIWDTSAFMVCTIIGSGIFISPTGVLQQTRSTGMALVMWLVTGLINLISAFCYAELVLTFPEAGSDYTYLRKGLGEFFAFLFIWVTFVFKEACARDVQALTFSTYFCQIFFGSCPPPENLKKLVAALAISAIIVLQCYSSKWSVKMAGFFTVTKLIGLVIIIIAGLVRLGMGETGNLTNMLEGSSPDPASYAAAFYSAFWAYSGIQECTNIVEELKEPLVKNVIVSIAISQVTVIVIYLLANFAYIIVLTPDEIFASEAVAMSFGEKIFSGLKWLMPFFVACSTFGAMGSGIMSASRLYLAATRHRHLPNSFAMLNMKYLTPIPIYTIYLIICLALLSTNSIRVLINYATYIEVVGMTFSIIALIYQRFRNPNLPRPYRNPIILPILFFLLLLILLCLPFYDDALATGICIIFIVTGIPVYFLLIWPARSPGWLCRLEQAVTHFVQKLTYSSPEDEAGWEKEGEAASGEVNLAMKEIKGK